MKSDKVLEVLFKEALKQLGTTLDELDPAVRPMISIGVFKRNGSRDHGYTAGNARAVLTDEGEWELQSIETHSNITMVENGRRKKIATTATEYIRE